MFKWLSGKAHEVKELQQQVEKLQQQTEVKEQENSLLKKDVESQTRQNDQLREQFTEYVKMEEIKKTFHGASDFIKDLLRPW